MICKQSEVVSEIVSILSCKKNVLSINETKIIIFIEY